MEQKLINDFEIMIQSIQSVSAHQFAGTMLLFVVEGTITVSMDGEEYFLQESDILIINRNTIYSIIGDSSNVVVSLAITNHFF
ncbi:cupin domain-containing protein [Carnobacterium jeotgali]|nr:cupin domain-containing protein [Carnobacterium jeotgali]